LRPIANHSIVEIGSFEALREMTVTGAVLTAPLMEWAHEAFGGKLHIGSSSGGTDVFCARRFSSNPPLLLPKLILLSCHSRVEYSTTCRRFAQSTIPLS
jgi:hypothetical protein